MVWAQHLVAIFKCLSATSVVSWIFSCSCCNQQCHLPWRAWLRARSFCWLITCNVFPPWFFPPIPLAQTCGSSSSSQGEQLWQHPLLRQGQICLSHLSFTASHFSSETKLLFYPSCLPFRGCPCGSLPALNNINLEGFWICFLPIWADHAGELFSPN